MPYLEKTLRRQLAATIGKAREVAEAGAADAIRRLGVAEDAAPPYLSDADRALRRLLRAHARSLGDAWDGKTLGTTGHLMETAAFEHWHRMLFGRFLVERGLLVDPASGATIAREELAELAAERGLADEWAVVEGIAAPSLPAVFKPGDPALAVPFAPEYIKRLRDLVAALPVDVFTSDDALGWTYQFWRAAEKDRVNRAGGKIGAAELPAVTQLFTEPYMVQFLLHNTLGAWWAGKVLAADPALATNAADEAALRRACALPGVDWAYLRFVREDGVAWRPAAGSFPGWPARAAEVTVCDPCCGSGHFLTEALVILTALRGREEGLDPAAAACAVLRDNLHGLEIDGRCVQIAAFNVALVAWGLAGGPVALLAPHLAWVGAPPPMGRTEMAALASGDAMLAQALAALHDQFVQAPLLGSLLEVGARDLLDSDLRERGTAALARLLKGEPEQVEGAVAARGLLAAAEILTKKYTLVSTNVPFLGRGKQISSITEYVDRHFSVAKADLATTMFQRLRQLSTENGTVACVTPQNWLFLGSYKSFRKDVLNHAALAAVVFIGEHGFDSDSAAGAFTALAIARNVRHKVQDAFFGIDASAARNVLDKSIILINQPAVIYPQSQQLLNPDFRISLTQRSQHSLLRAVAVSSHGQGSFDSPRFNFNYWEISAKQTGWVLQQSPPAKTEDFSGCHFVFRWQNGDGDLAHLMREKADAGYASGKWRAGVSEWGKSGILSGLMRDISTTRYLGYSFDDSSSVIIPTDPGNLPALWALCSSSEFSEEIRKIDRKIYVTCQSLTKIPFDLAHWQAVAAERYPNGLPEPYSDDPTQWLFHGHPAHAEPGTELHVALARLAGYRWPAETDIAMRLAPLARDRIGQLAVLPPADLDGLLTLHPHGSGRSLADRLRAYLAAAYDTPLTPAREAELVRAADAKLNRAAAPDATLEIWLRDRAFRQHCTLFHNRPFLWHVWDGLRDGFSAFVHYHRLDRALLQRLAYTHLGDWIAHARGAGQTVEHERATRLQQDLARILAGETPHDIFVRWKPLHRQPVGWAPDLDDGVRLNIRPFMEAKVLREQPRGIAWGKDRGTDVASAPWYDLGPQYGDAIGARINEHHLTLAEKQAARAQAAD